MANQGTRYEASASYPGGRDCLQRSVLPVALFDDGVVALNGDGIGGFGRHRDALVVMAAG